MLLDFLNVVYLDVQPADVNQHQVPHAAINDLHHYRNRICSPLGTAEVSVQSYFETKRNSTRTTKRRSAESFASNMGMPLSGPDSRFWLSNEKCPRDSSLQTYKKMITRKTGKRTNFIFLTMILKVGRFFLCSRRCFSARVEMYILQSPNPLTLSK